MSGEDSVVGTFADSAERFRLNVDLYSILLEFSSPASLEEVHQRLELDEPVEALAQALEEPIRQGVLVPHAPERQDSQSVSLSEVGNRPLLSLLQDPGKVLARQLDQDGACIIQSAFSPEFAKAVSRELTEAPLLNWLPSERQDPYWNLRCHVWNPTLVLPAVIQKVRAALEHPETKRMVGASSGLDCSGPLNFEVMALVPGDFITPRPFPHDQATVGFMWFLPPSWEARWGGYFFCCSSRNSVMPSFNQLALFGMAREGQFALCPLTNDARAPLPLLYGFWSSRQPAPVKVPGQSPKWYAGPPLEQVDPDVFVTSK